MENRPRSKKKDRKRRKKQLIQKQGVYLLENTTLPGGSVSTDVIGGKHTRGKRKRVESEKRRKDQRNRENLI
jgi:hypothetical protein